MIIPGYSAYDISEDGVVTKVSTHEVIQPYIVKRRNNISYTYIALVSNDRRLRVHNVLRLLAITYLGMPERGYVARAKDGNNLNATLSNVVWSTRRDVTKQTWEEGKMATREKRQRCYNDDSIELIYETLLAYEEPITMAELSCILQIPYTVVRYSMQELRKTHRVRKTDKGFEVRR